MRSASLVTRGSVMSVLISHPAGLEDRPKGPCPLGAERPRESGSAVGIALRVKRHGDPIRPVLQLRQLEENVPSRFTQACRPRQPAGACRACDLHVVRETFRGADEKRAWQLERGAP